MKKFPIPLIFLSFLAACTPTRPEVRYASENSIEIVYSAYGAQPTLTAEAIDMAIKHCEEQGKGMKHVSSAAANEFTAKEIHTFMCTNDFVDERIEVQVKEK